MSTFINPAIKHAATFSNVQRHVSVMTDATKNGVKHFLLRENGTRLLLETGGRIIISDANLISWSNVSKH